MNWDAEFWCLPNFGSLWYNFFTTEILSSIHHYVWITNTDERHEIIFFFFFFFFFFFRLSLPPSMLKILANYYGYSQIFTIFIVDMIISPGRNVTMDASVFGLSS